VIPALIAYRHDNDQAVAHAVGQHSDRAFCGQWTLEQSDRRWPTERDEWQDEHPRCPVCTVLVYR
jgi:hypothetical protein